MSKVISDSSYTSLSSIAKCSETSFIAAEGEGATPDISTPTSDSSQHTSTSPDAMSHKTDTSVAKTRNGDSLIWNSANGMNCTPGRSMATRLILMATSSRQRSFPNNRYMRKISSYVVLLITVESPRSPVVVETCWPYTTLTFEETAEFTSTLLLVGCNTAPHHLEHHHLMAPCGP